MMIRALVTGADGFIGSHLTELLVEEGYDVVALAQYNSFNDWGWLEDVGCKDRIEIISGDIRDPECCRTITQEIDVVFHLAALIAIPYSYRSPNSYLDTNVNGTVNICQASRSNSVKRVIHTSTSEVYGTAKYVPIDEDHPLQPQSPYSATKIAADAMAMSFYYSFELPVTIARPFNTYGPRQSARAVLPTIISQIANGIEDIKLGDVRPTRDFNYVEDICRGFLDLSKVDQSVGRTVNIGSNTEISIEETLNIVKEIMGSDVDFIVDDQRVRPKKSEVFRLRCDNSLAKELIGYEPKVDIKSGLERTINWITDPAHLSRYKEAIYNV